MINPILSEGLAREHRRDLMESAAFSRLARGALTPRRYRLRERAGWWLVHAGVRMALASQPLQSVPAHPGVPPRLQGS